MPFGDFEETSSYSRDGVRKERSGWRDLGLSQRHRDWGFNCPASDVDFAMIEYNRGLPVGLVEYKHCFARFPDTRHPTYRALKEWCDGYCPTIIDPPVRDPLPFLVAFYWPDIWAFRVFPVNETAKAWFVSSENLSELEYVKRLYRMRRFTLAKDLEGKLNKEFPPSRESAADYRSA